MILFGFISTTSVYFTDRFVHDEEHLKLPNPLQCSETRDKSKCTSSAHQVHHTEAVQDRLSYLSCPNPIPAQKNPNSVQISMKLHISTFTVLLLSKGLGQTFVSPLNTTQATQLPPCDLLRMKSWQCSFGNSSFWSSPAHHWGRAEFHHYFLSAAKSVVPHRGIHLVFWKIHICILC